MKKFWQILNGVCILFMLGAFVWAGFAIGHHAEFSSRMNVVFLAQIPCLLFFGIRKLKSVGRG